jgi:glycosyltransferase involved in cell wall biosynthesis
LDELLESAMRICIFFRDDLSPDEGPTVVLRNLIQEWRHSHDVTLLTGFPGNLKLRGIDCEYVPIAKHPSGDALWSTRLFRHIAKIQKSDVILAQGSAHVIPFLVRVRFSGLRLPPFLLRVDSNEYLDDCVNSRVFSTRARSYVRQRMSIALADLIVTVSRLAKENLTDYYGCGKKTCTVPNGVSVEIFHRMDTKKENYILFVGNLREHFDRKGMPTLLRAFSLLARESDVLLIVAGMGNSRLKEMSADLGVDSRIRHVGFLAQRELVEWYNRASVFVLPSLFDPYGLVVNEAMACGTPVVVSDQVGAVDVVREANAGLVFRTGDPVSLYEALKRLTQDKGLASQMGNNACRFVTRSLTWASVAQRYLRLFETHSRGPTPRAS